VRCGLAAVVAALVLAVVPRGASAQDNRLYAGGSLFVSMQDSHRQGTAPSLPLTGVGGTTWGIGAEFGGLVAEHVAIGVEFTLPARIESVQETDYSRVFQTANRYRDVTLTGVVRFRTSPLGSVRIAAVAGGGLVHESALQRRRDGLSLFGDASGGFGPYGQEIPTDRWTTGIVFGGDVEVAVSPHLSVVPSLRIHLVRRSDDPGELMWALGLSSVVWRPGFSLRTTF
jgi:hypothetical protein